jgi:hypothetical protein
MQQRLDGRDRDVEVLSDAVVTPALSLAQVEHLAVAGRQPVHRFGEMIVVDRGVQGVVLGFDGPEVDVGRRLDSGRAPVVIDAQALGDDRHPRVEAALTGERGQSPQRANEGLLRELLGGMGVADPAPWS